MTVSLGRGWNARGLSAGTVYGKNMLSNVVLLVYMIFIISINGSTVTAIDREEWYVQVTGDPQLAEEIAKKNGFTSFGQVSTISEIDCINLSLNYYRLGIYKITIALCEISPNMMTQMRFIRS